MGFREKFFGAAMGLGLAGETMHSPEAHAHEVSVPNIEEAIKTYVPPMERVAGAHGENPEEMSGLQPMFLEDLKQTNPALSAALEKEGVDSYADFADGTVFGRLDKKGIPLELHVGTQVGLLEPLQVAEGAFSSHEPGGFARSSDADKMVVQLNVFAQYLEADMQAHLESGNTSSLYVQEAQAAVNALCKAVGNQESSLVAEMHNRPGMAELEKRCGVSPHTEKDEMVTTDTAAPTEKAPLLKLLARVKGEESAEKA